MPQSKNLLRTLDERDRIVESENKEALYRKFGGEDIWFGVASKCNPHQNERDYYGCSLDMLDNQN